MTTCLPATFAWTESNPGFKSTLTYTLNTDHTGEWSFKGEDDRTLIFTTFHNNGTFHWRYLRLPFRFGLLTISKAIDTNGAPAAILNRTNLVRLNSNLTGGTYRNLRTTGAFSVAASA